MTSLNFTGLRTVRASSIWTFEQIYYIKYYFYPYEKEAEAVTSQYFVEDSTGRTHSVQVYNWTQNFPGGIFPPPPPNKLILCEMAW